jgi:hypothetical protein
MNMVVCTCDLSTYEG